MLGSAGTNARKLLIPLIRQVFPVEQEAKRRRRRSPPSFLRKPGSIRTRRRAGIPHNSGIPASCSDRSDRLFARPDVEHSVLDVGSDPLRGVAAFEEVE